MARGNLARDVAHLCVRWMRLRDWLMALFIVYALLIIFIAFDDLFGNTIRISVIEGIIFVLYLIFYVLYLYKSASKDKKEIASLEKDVSENSKEEHIVISIIKVIFAIAFLAFGSDLFVDSSVSIFSRFINKHVIGIVVVAVGTSIPELVTSIIAAIKKESDISVGNIIGSNIFNVAAALGLSSVIGSSLVFDSVAYIDYAVMFFTAILLFIFMRRGRSLKIVHGVIFLSIYVIYVSYLVYSGRV